MNENIETSEDNIMPLPLTNEQIYLLDKDDVTMANIGNENISANDDLIRRLYPEINIVPNISGVVIPIISGITLYSYIRYFHAFSTRNPVDIYVNGKIIARNVLYREFTNYFKVFPGYYRIAVYETGKNTIPLAFTFINIIGYRIYTAGIIKNNIGGAIELIGDSIRPLPKNRAYIRFAQLSHNAPSMDAYLDNSLVLENMNYKELYAIIRLSKKHCKYRVFKLVLFFMSKNL